MDDLINRIKQLVSEMNLSTEECIEQLKIADQMIKKAKKMKDSPDVISSWKIYKSEIQTKLGEKQ